VINQVIHNCQLYYPVD